MNTWAALIIIIGTSPMNVAIPSNDGITTKSVMVETNVVASIPTQTTITFATEKLCNDARIQIVKAQGVQSVTCFRTTEDAITSGSSFSIYNK